MEEKGMKKNNLGIIITAAVIALIVALGAVYFLFIKGNGNDLSIEPQAGVLKSVQLSSNDTVIRVGGKDYKVCTSDDGLSLLINDKNIIDEDGNNVHASYVYITNDFVFFTNRGQSEFYISYAFDRYGNKLTIDDGEYQMDNIRMENGSIVATGFKCCLFDGMEDDGTYGEKELIIKYANNTLTVTPTNNTITKANVYGTYYNNDEKNVYFTLNSDNTCVLREPSCGDTSVAPKTIPCKITMDNDSVNLSFDVNDNQKYEFKLIGSKNNGVYRFKTVSYPEYYSCAISSESYFNKK